MKRIIIILASIGYFNITNGQIPFILNIEQPEVDYICDVINLNDRYYFIQNRNSNFVPHFYYDSYSDLIVTDESGKILETHNLNGLDYEYHRFIKTEGDKIYLLGSLNSDTCRSTIIISTFDIHLHVLEQISSYELCEHAAIILSTVKGLNNKTFIEVTHSSTSHYTRKKILELDSNYQFTLIFENINSIEEFSVDFSGKGYVIASVGLYSFFDTDFNLRKKRSTSELHGLAYFATHTPFGNHLMLEHSTQTSFLEPDPGIQIRLVDSNLVIKKKIVIHPEHRYTSYMEMPLNKGLDIQNDNEIWSAGRYAELPAFDSCVFYISKIDSNLNVQCQHFIGYDGIYRLWGIKAFEDGGAIVYGNRVRDGLPFNEGEDIFALRVGENCELPTVSTTDPNHPLVSISAYPNPTINSLTFDVNGFDPSSLKVEIIDVVGTILFSKKDLSYEIKVADMPPGQYFYRILEGDKILGVGAWVKQ